MKRQARQPSPLGGVLRRAWWSLLVLVHVPALLGVGRALLVEPRAATVLTALALGLTVAIFCLKVADAPLLRFRSRRASAGVFLLACCLVHHEVAVSEAGREVFEQTPAALAVGAVIETLRRARPALRGLRTRLAAAASRRDRLIRIGLRSSEIVSPAATAPLMTALMPRAPPA